MRVAYITRRLTLSRCCYSNTAERTREGATATTPPAGDRSSCRYVFVNIFCCWDLIICERRFGTPFNSALYFLVHTPRSYRLPLSGFCARVTAGLPQRWRQQLRRGRSEDSCLPPRDVSISSRRGKWTQFPVKALNASCLASVPDILTQTLVFCVGQRLKSTGRHHPRMPDRSPLPPLHHNSGPVLPARRRGRGIAWLHLWLRGWTMALPPLRRLRHHLPNTFRQLRRRPVQSPPCRNTERVLSSMVWLYLSYHQHRVQPGQGLSHQPEKRKVPPRARHRALLRGSPMRR